VLDTRRHGSIDRSAVLLAAMREVGGADEEHPPAAGECGAQARRVGKVAETHLGSARREIGERIGTARDENETLRPVPREHVLGRLPAELA
jgi:hypothetical protein